MREASHQLPEATQTPRDPSPESPLAPKKSEGSPHATGGLTAYANWEGWAVILVYAVMPPGHVAGLQWREGQW